jgi:hypothetical protein
MATDHTAPGMPSFARSRLFTFPNLEEVTAPGSTIGTRTVVSRSAICPDCENHGRVELDRHASVAAAPTVAPCPRCLLGSKVDETTRTRLAGDREPLTFWERVADPSSVVYEGGRTILHDPCDGCRDHGIVTMLAPGSECRACAARVTVRLSADTRQYVDALRRDAAALSDALGRSVPPNNDAQEGNAP